jgi:hypothetical protein
MTGSKWVDHWTSGTVYECSEIAAGSPQGSPAADYVGCEAGRRTCSERETGTEEVKLGQKSCVRPSGIIVGANQHSNFPSQVLKRLWQVLIPQLDLLSGYVSELMAAFSSGPIPRNHSVLLHI